MRGSAILGAAALMVGLGANCGRQPAAPPAPLGDTITSDQILRSEATNAYEVIERLKPNFLASRGPISLHDPTAGAATVYLDDVPYGPIASLTSIPAGDVAIIRMYRASEATFRFGTGNAGGVIDVITRH